MKTLVETLFGKDAFATPEAIILQRTELGRYAECPHQANLCEQHPEATETHDILPETGKLIHAIAKEAINACDYNLQEAADYIAEELPKIRPDLQPEALRAGKNLANEIRRFSGNRVLLCEEPITRSLMPATEKQGEVLIVSELDLVLATTKADSILVLDYKTGYKNRTNQEAEDDFQTCVGCWNLFGKFPDVNTINWFYLNTRIHTRSYARIERNAMVGANDLTQELAFEARIFETVRLKLDGCDEAWPEPNKCSQCLVTQWCDADKDIEVESLAKNPQKYLDAYIVLEEKNSKMLKTMKAYVKNGRVIYGTANRFSFEPKLKYLPKLFKNKDGEEE